MFRAQKKGQSITSQSVQLRAQVDSAIEITTQTLLRKEYLVVPVIAMVEGVRFGANADAPELGLATEFGADVITWANRPLVLNHPQIEVDGEWVYCTANTPEILEVYAFGMTMNPYVDDGKLKMEAWIDQARVNELGGEFQEILDMIQDGEMVELSVGFFSTLEQKKGKFRGQSYSGIWRNIKPDHLAILSVGTLGACSNADGCGIPRINKEAAMPKNVQVTVDPVKTNANAGCSCGGSDASGCSCTNHNDDVVVNDAQQPTAEEIENHLADEPDRKEVRMMTSKIITQAIDGLLADVDVRKLLIKSLRTKYANNDVYLFGFTSEKAIFESYGYYNPGGYHYKTFQIGINVTESAVEFVGEAEEVVLLTKIVPVSDMSAGTQPLVQTKENDMAGENKTTPVVQEENKTVQEPAVTTPATTPATTTTIAPTTQAAEPKPITAQAYIEQAPPEIREMLQSSMKLHQDRKNALIEGIKANASNKFSEEQLKAFDLGMLENLAALASVAAPAPNYGGVAAPIQPTNQAQAEVVPEPPRLFAVKK